MTPEKAKTLMCPFQQSETTTIKCIADKCMAWQADNDDEGYCELIHGISGWISRIANRMQNG